MSIRFWPCAKPWAGATTKPCCSPTTGSIAEGSGENIFLVYGGKLLTNDERHSILLGVTRDAIIEIACNLGLPVEIRAIQVNDLLSADEAFFTGTAVEVTPIREECLLDLGTGYIWSLQRRRNPSPQAKRPRLAKLNAGK